MFRRGSSKARSFRHPDTVDDRMKRSGAQLREPLTEGAATARDGCGKPKPQEQLPEA